MTKDKLLADYAAGRRNFSWVDINGADLRYADLRGADLSGAGLRGADLRATDLRGATLRGADLRGANFSGADLRGADLRYAAGIVQGGTRSDGYTFYLCLGREGGPYVKAGCRWFTLAQAAAHWTADKRCAAETAAILTGLKAQAAALGLL